MSVTVLLPAWNAASWIEGSIRSILRQSFGDFELWVLESGSSDETVDVARGFSDPRVKVFEFDSLGFQERLQWGIENAQTPWLARMDADDLSFPERLAIQVQALEADQELVFVGTDYAVLTPFGHVFERLPAPKTRPIDRSLLAKGRRFADPSVVFSRKAAIEVGGMDREFSMGDYPFFFRLLCVGGGLEIGSVLYLRRLREDSLERVGMTDDAVRRVLTKYASDVEWGGFSSYRTTPFWTSMATLALIAGDFESVGKSIQQALASGEPLRTLRKLQFASRLGLLGQLVYAWRRRKGYRHRPDLLDHVKSLMCESIADSTTAPGFAGEVRNISG